jgi:hypothetical protein
MKAVLYTELFVNETEVLSKEKELLAKGYRLKHRTDSHQLKPYEYYKQRLGGSRVSLSREPLKYEIAWCSPR